MPVDEILGRNVKHILTGSDRDSNERVPTNVNANNVDDDIEKLLIVSVNNYKNLKFR